MSSPDRAIPTAILREHVTRLQDLMRAENMAAVLLFHSSQMLAYTGTGHSSSDRVTCGAVTADGKVIVICPTFERPAVAGAEDVATVTTWEEHESPYECFAQALAAAGVKSGTLGVDGRAWLEYMDGFAGALPNMKLVSAASLLREVRLCKSPAEQDVMRAAHRKGEQVFLALRDGMMRPGVSEIDLMNEALERFKPEGITALPLIQSGPNASIPHNPTGPRRIQEGDAIVVDSVIRWQGYHNDITRTFAIGQPSAKTREAYRIVREAQRAAIDAARPGIPCHQLDDIARKIITDAGFGPYFAHRLGHGMGLEGHEPPYLAAGNTERLRPGACVTIEPGIYVPGEFGIRIEDDIFITENGCEVIRGELPTDVAVAFED